MSGRERQREGGCRREREGEGGGERGGCGLTEEYDILKKLREREFLVGEIHP